MRLRLSSRWCCCFDCYYCSGGLRRAYQGRGQMCRPVFGGGWMLRGSGYRWDSHPGCSCLGYSRRHLGAIGEDFRVVNRGLVLLRRLHRLHQLLLPLRDRVHLACCDDDEAVDGRGRIPSRSRMDLYYERLQSEISCHGLDKTRWKERETDYSFVHCGSVLFP